MNKKVSLLLMVTICAIAFFVSISVISKSKGVESLESVLSPTPVPPNAPKTFKFDSSTDLKVELEKINPQILDSDFQ